MTIPATFGFADGCFGSEADLPYAADMNKGSPPDRHRFLADILTNRFNRMILESWEALELQDGWLVAGCLFKTVWNLQSGRAPEDGQREGGS